MPLNASAEGKVMLYPISMEGKWGFIDAAGRIVIEPRFLNVGQFSEGLAKVTVPGLTDEDQLFDREASGFIDERGEFVIGPGSPSGYKFRDRKDYCYGDFHDGLAKFWVGDSTGYGGFIDRTGRIAVSPKYAAVDDFSQGLACVSLPRKDGSAFGPKLTGFINTKGKFVIPAKHEFTALGFSEGLCVIDIQDDDAEWHPSVINLSGETVIPPGIYTGISDFVGGISRVVKDGKVGCINNKGEIVVPIEFDQLWEFEENSYATAEKGSKNFIIDRTGRCAKEISLGVDVDLCRLRSGLATARSQNRVGYVNAEGKLAIPMRFDRGEDFHGELAKAESNGYKGYINQRGEFVWKTDQWDERLRNAVEKPLADFLPPITVESLPLEYNWQGVKNAIVFASNEKFDSLQLWFTKKLGKGFELLDENSELGAINISFFGEELSGSFHAVDANGDGAEGFMGFYASRNMKLLKEKHKPAVLGILIMHR